MTRLFSMKVMIDLHSPSEEDMQIVDELLDLFPLSNYLLTQKALIHYHQKGSGLQYLLEDNSRWNNRLGPSGTSF
jgi:hypothetical protein